MIRYSCDMCGRSLVPEEDDRYVVKIEVYSACDSMDADCEDEEFINDFEEDDDEDESDEEMDNLDPDEIESIEYKTFRYDLCCKCHSRYLQDPLSIKSIRRGRFSEN
ncbi:MAG: hypothetical protein HON76_13455 [Candidatus Scalindua sp.]|jgi:hypothetical protein|nr:hypothetical protein [Candidatus Scalindua sp.]MBT5306505.1 hypothetical protein [Candidatus Scalindua sp.]MBT6051442.1 hypothetical protein [Candidatus Scalindua sp.]MBT6226919.1 hypothetical protein [Candidatus Scalindua sp.]MBT6563523.1 hypothetical protein [Candidatus Scalindua sp.]